MKKPTLPKKPIKPSLTKNAEKVVIYENIITGGAYATLQDIIDRFKAIAKKHKTTPDMIEMHVNHGYSSLRDSSMRKTKEPTAKEKDLFNKELLAYEEKQKTYDKQMDIYNKQIGLYKELLKEEIDLEHQLKKIVENKKSQLQTKYLIESKKLSESIENKEKEIKKEE